MKLNNLKIKLLATVFTIILFWQILKLWSFYTEKSVPKKIVERQKPQQVLVSVYYEALCPDSRNFIIKQLVPTFDSIEDYLELHLIPYGKAETIVVNDDFVFKCQHGETECEANIIHACSIDKIKDSRKQLELVACMIRNNMHPPSILKSCAGEMSEYKAILNCSQSSEGRKLLSKYGELTKSLRPKVNFIPTITLDNDQDNQILILKNLLRQICQRLEVPPKECKN